MPVLAVSPLATVGISAGVAAIVSLTTLWVTGLRQERARRRDFYASALAATMAYREFPYAILRRRHEEAERSGERVRISEALREVQADISQHEALMKVERASKVTHAYLTLVVKTREIAGSYMHEAWKTDPIETDREMNQGAALSYSTLDKYVTDYLDAVARDLRWWRFWR